MTTLNIAGCKHTTKDLIKGLQRAGFNIDLVITLEPKYAAKNKVAGYFDLRPFLHDEGIEYYLVDDYNLKSDADIQALSQRDLGVLLCMGWQRLIPEWLLKYLDVGAFGMHGSNKPLPHGRGRSPMNWSLIQGKEMFFTHFFQYKSGVDDGDVIGFQLFDITPYDTAHTLHIKNLLSMIKLCETHLTRVLENNFSTTPQKEVEPSFYPKRTETDGIIFWEDSTQDVYNLVRAITHPFPGAFSFYGKSKVKMWKVIPFDTHIRWDNAESGEICEVLYDGSFIVKTGDTSVLVLEYEGIHTNELEVGESFNSNNIPRKKWPNLPR